MDDAPGNNPSRTLRDVVGTEHSLDRLFHPRSIAVIGASGSPGTLSWWPLHHLVSRGFAGDIYPVNPNRAELEGIRCYPSLDEIPEGIDVAMVALNAEAAVETARRCADRGFGAVVLPAQGIGERGPEGRRVEHEMVEYLQERGTRLAGPNADGLGNLSNGALVTIQPLFDQGIESGRVAVVAQSGATAGSLLERLRREGIGCKLYASTGNEADLGVEDHLSYMLQDPDVDMVLSFVESIRRPDAFLRVAELARELGKPVGLIKVGRSSAGATRAAAHTGALAGEDAIYEALFAASGIVRVAELGELVALAKLYLTVGSPRVDGVGIMSVSGGQAGAVADVVAGANLPTPEIEPATRQRLDELLEFGDGFNPCDLTGEVARDPTLASSVYSAFGDQADIGTVIYARKLLTGTASVDAAANLALEVGAPGRAALVAYAMDGSVPDEEARHYATAGVPVFDSLHELTTALRGLARHRSRLEAASGAPMRPVDIGLPPQDLLVSLESGGTLDERRAKQLVTAYGLPTPGEVLATTEDEAAAAAASLGYPIVCKIVSTDLPHKTEVGGVVLGLRSADEVRAAFRQIVERAAAAFPNAAIDGVSVQREESPVQV
jgi:acyl-CoA synthetase (NDP forming)